MIFMMFFFLFPLFRYLPAAKIRGCPPSLIDMFKSVGIFVFVDFEIDGMRGEVSDLGLLLMHRWHDSYGLPLLKVVRVVRMGHNLSVSSSSSSIAALLARHAEKAANENAHDYERFDHIVGAEEARVNF